MNFRAAISCPAEGQWPGSAEWTWVSAHRAFPLGWHLLLLGLGTYRYWAHTAPLSVVECSAFHVVIITKSPRAAPVFTDRPEMLSWADSSESTLLGGGALRPHPGVPAAELSSSTSRAILTLGRECGWRSCPSSWDSEGTSPAAVGRISGVNRRGCQGVSPGQAAAGVHSTQAEGQGRELLQEAQAGGWRVGRGELHTPLHLQPKAVLQPEPREPPGQRPEAVPRTPSWHRQRRGEGQCGRSRAQPGGRTAEKQKVKGERGAFAP